MSIIIIISFPDDFPVIFPLSAFLISSLLVHSFADQLLSFLRDPSRPLRNAKLYRSLCCITAGSHFSTWMTTHDPFHLW